MNNIAVNAILARLLTPDDMGLYFLVASIVHFFMLFSGFGMERSIVRLLSEALAFKDARRTFDSVKYIMQIGFLSSVIVALILFSRIGRVVTEKIFGSDISSGAMVYAGLWIIILTMRKLIVESFRGFHDIRFAIIFQGLISSFISACVLGLVFIENVKITLETVLLIVIASYGASLVFASVFLLIKLLPFKNGREKQKISRLDVLKGSWVLWFLNLMNFLTTSGLIWLLAYFSSKESVAIYGAVARLMVLITTTLTMLKMVTLPMVGDLYAKGKFKKLEKVLRVTATYAGLPSIIGLMVLALFGRSFLTFLYGTHYALGYTTLLVLSIANIINVFTGTPGLLMVMASREKVMLAFRLISGTIGFIVCILLVDTLDHVGVAIAAGTGDCLFNLAMMVYCRRKLSINTLMSFSEIRTITMQAVQIIRQYFSISDSRFKAGYRFRRVQRNTERSNLMISIKKPEKWYRGKDV